MAGTKAGSSGSVRNQPKRFCQDQLETDARLINDNDGEGHFLPGMLVLHLCLGLGLAKGDSRHTPRMVCVCVCGLRGGSRTFEV